MEKRKQQKILTINNPEEALYYLQKEREKRIEFHWQMVDGKVIKIENMTDTHLDDTIKKLERLVYSKNITK